jgi:NAD(P)-dependent dehydrogenase (short-subunit alcohol dehydrogenase family)
VNDLRGRTVLVTGASKGIGRACVETLGARGAHVVAHYGSDREGAEQAIAGLPAGAARTLGADLAVPGEARRLWEEALAWRGRIDALVVNAAVLVECPPEQPDEVWDAAWERSFAVNATSAAQLVRAALAHHVEHGGGVVIGLGSASAQGGSGNPALLAYTASKGALMSLLHTAARTYARHGVLVYCVSPGLVRTGMSANVGATRGGEEAVTAALPLREWVPPAEIGELVAFLASGRQRHLTGATFDVNGAAYVR